jgi:hypothetical protein
MKNRKFNFLASLLPVFALASPVMAAQENKEAPSGLDKALDKAKTKIKAFEQNLDQIHLDNAANQKNPKPNFINQDPKELLAYKSLDYVNSALLVASKGTAPEQKTLDIISTINEALKSYFYDYPKLQADDLLPMFKAAVRLKKFYATMVEMDLGNQYYSNEKSKAHNTSELLFNYLHKAFERISYQDLQKYNSYYKDMAIYFAEIANTIDKEDELYIKTIDFAISIYEKLKRNQFPSYINPAQKNRLHAKAIDWYSNEINQFETLDQAAQNSGQKKYKIQRYRIRLDELNKNLNAPN